MKHPQMPIKYYPTMGKGQIKRAMPEIHGVIGWHFDNDDLPDGAWFYGMTDLLIEHLSTQRGFTDEEADEYSLDFFTYYTPMPEFEEAIEVTDLMNDYPHLERGK